MHYRNVRLFFQVLIASFPFMEIFKKFSTYEKGELVGPVKQLMWPKLCDEKN